MPPLFSDGNPVLRRELFNVLRSRKSFVLLFLYAAALTGIVYVAWPPAGEPRAVQSEKTRILFNVFARGQMVMIAMLAPAFSAGCMTVEKERRSLDLLLTTPLRGGAVLWGKYLASAAYLVLLTAATAPMVASFLYLPGLDPEEVAGLYLFLLAESCCFGMVGLTASVFLPRTQAALSIAYLAILPASAILLLVSLAFPRFFHVGAAVWPSAIMATAALSMYVACRSRMARPFDPVPKSWDEEDVSSQSGLVLVRDRFPDRLLLPSRRDELMEDGTDPVLYKEMRCEVFGRGTLFLRLIIQVSMFMAVVFLTFLYMGYEHVFVYYLLAFSVLVAPAFSCNTFTQERERGTLDMLLTTLVPPRRIVLGKFLSSYRLSMMLTGLVGMAMLFYLVAPIQDASVGFGERLARLGIYALIVGSTVLFETVVAMFISLLSGTTSVSMIASYATVLLVLVAPAAAEVILRVFTEVRMEEIARYLVTCPFAAVHSVAPRGAGEAMPPVWIPYLAVTISASAALLGVMAKWMRPLMDSLRPGG